MVVSKPTAPSPRRRNIEASRSSRPDSTILTAPGATPAARRNGWNIWNAPSPRVAMMDLPARSGGFFLPLEFPVTREAGGGVQDLDKENRRRALLLLGGPRFTGAA